MSVSSTGSRGEPQFTSSGNTPTFAADLTAVADYAADHAYHEAGSTSARNARASTGWLGLHWFDTDELKLYRWVTGGTWTEIPVTGQVLISRQTMTTANSLTIDNLFSSTLADIYDVVVDLTSTSVATGISLLMRASGSDYTTGNQVARYFEMNGVTPGYSNSTTATALVVGRANGAGGGVATFRIMSPASAQYTRVVGQGHDDAISRMHWNAIPNTNQFTGMKIKLDGVVTGSGVVTVYALRKS